MSCEQKRPILVLLTSHWITMAGVTLVTLAGCSWLFLLPAHIRGHVDNPYIGLLIFIAIPAVFFAGLVLIPAGIALSKRTVIASFASPTDRQTAWRRAGVFFAVMTLANIIIGSQLSYRAVEHMETIQFCGQSCHVMKPEFTAHQIAPHSQVACVSCHVAPGASGWVKSKMSGTRQLAAVVFNSYPRPIESAMESNRLVSSADTCEQCHDRQKPTGPRLRVISKFKDDEANSRTESVLMMRVGGGTLGGIHGAHIGPGVRIRYAASDKKRQTIPWVEYRNTETNVTRTYLAGDTQPVPVSSLPTFEMQCADCHNRAAHSFQLPDRAIDEAMARGQIRVGLPFVKKTAMGLLKASYSSDDEATRTIPDGLAAYYQGKYPAIASQRTADIHAAGQALLAIYRHNVFPDLKVTWGTYSNNLGHVDDPGCFRCHDDSHATRDKKTITQDCNACHESLAVEETSPEILKTLGVAARPELP
jgi:nitrate/TMAO reductase-like tetraheme cytochrome c subunit